MNDPKDSEMRADANGPDQLEPTPRWVKIFGVVVVALLLAVMAKHLLGGGFRNHLP